MMCLPHHLDLTYHAIFIQRKDDWSRLNAYEYLQSAIVMKIGSGPAETVAMTTTPTIYK